MVLSKGSRLSFLLSHFCSSSRFFQKACFYVVCPLHLSVEWIPHHQIVAKNSKESGLLWEGKVGLVSPSTAASPVPTISTGTVSQWCPAQVSPASCAFLSITSSRENSLLLALNCFFFSCRACLCCVCLSPEPEWIPLKSSPQHFGSYRTLFSASTSHLTQN